jgi:hypothetical protein
MENQKVRPKEKAKKMGMVHGRFRSSPGRDRVVVAKSVTEHGHPGLRGTSPSDVSAKLPHVGHRSEILDGLIERNKLVQQDGNHDPFINQNTIRQELSETVQGCVLVFPPQLLRRLTTEPNNVFHNVRDIDPFPSKMGEDPSALKRPPMHGMFQARVLTREREKVGRYNF